MISDVDAFSEANKSDLEMQDDNYEGSAARIDNKAHQKRQKVEPKLTTRFLGDLFRTMDRVKVLMHHNCKSVYSKALWEEFFIIYAGDAERVNKFMEQKGCSWSITMTFNFSYIDFCVKITVLPPHMMYCRVKAVFDFFTIINIIRHVIQYSMIRLAKNHIVFSRKLSEGLF